MNAQENTRLVQQAYQSIKAGDIQALLNALAADVQWQLPEMENVPFAGMWQGREAVGQFFNKVFEVQDVIEAVIYGAGGRSAVRMLVPLPARVQSPMDRKHRW
jgi:ketosteroid isomerase-like protein